MSQKVIERLVGSNPKGVAFDMSRKDGRTHICATTENPSTISDEFVRRMIATTCENGYVPMHIETETCRIHMEITAGKAEFGKVERIARDDREMLIMLCESERIHRVPLSGVGSRQDILLTRIGDYVTVLQREVEGHFHACGMINNSMHDRF